MGWPVLNWGERWAYLEWVAPIGALHCANLMALSAEISWRAMRPLMASMAPWALNLGLWVRRLDNSCGQGFANSGYPGSGRCPGSEVKDDTGEEEPDRLIRCLVDDAYEVWVERDKINPHIIHQIRSLPWVPCHSNGFQTTQEINFCWICSNNLILRDMWVRSFYVIFM